MSQIIRFLNFSIRFKDSMGLMGGNIRKNIFQTLSIKMLGRFIWEGGGRSRVLLLANLFFLPEKTIFFFWGGGRSTSDNFFVCFVEEIKYIFSYASLIMYVNICSLVKIQFLNLFQ